jgi:DNA-binding helix-hairpin-helix protein with protein kinase domain
VETLFTSKGQPVVLGGELGRGGEGVVHALEGAAWSDKAGKVYLKALDASKQEKLRFMAGHGSADVLKYTAWPVDTLHRHQGGPVCGLIMTRLSALKPVHVLYNPKQREMEFPNSDWRFLLFVSRNIAAAFDALHGSGHVVGDVNQNNVLVSTDSKVTIIDCDSFQVKTSKETFLCGVGASHFTPPELQRTTSFAKSPRTANNDNFGLALLIFHLLFGGRHPYSGRPLTTLRDQSLEDNIAQFRFAYAADAKARGIEPPPGALKLDLLPSTMQRQFVQAFTEEGGLLRPTAAEWAQSLDRLRANLKTCTVQPQHWYLAERRVCPWCELERSGITYFGPTAARPASNSNLISDPVFALGALWLAIEEVPVPATRALPSELQFRVTGAPWSSTMTAKRVSHVLTTIRTLIAVVAMAITIVAPGAFVVTFFAALGLAWGAQQVVGKATREEKTRRTYAAKSAQASMEAAKLQFEKVSVRNAFDAKRQELAEARKSYLATIEQRNLAVRDLERTASSRQLELFLSNFSIEDATISGIGPSRKADLRSYGISSASDVSESQVLKVPGFGEVTTGKLIAWRRSCELRFKFDPTKAVTHNDRMAVHAKFATRIRVLQSTIQNGPASLRAVIGASAEPETTALGELRTATESLAQANADLAVLR